MCLKQPKEDFVVASKTRPSNIYRFLDYDVKNINNIDLQNMLAIVIDLYLKSDNANVDEIERAFKKECLCISKIEDEIKGE